MQEVISEEELNAHIKESKERFSRLCSNHSAGLLSDDECFKEFRQVIVEGFHEYLNRHRIYARFSDEAYVGFLEDYNLWKAGTPPHATTGKPWLVDGDRKASSVSDKILFFKLMAAYCIPTSYFKPIPDSYIRPKIHSYANGLGRCGLIWFNLVDDGGMYASDDPIGKECVLTDESGLKAEIFIERTGREDEIHNIMDPQYVGQGTIEGYTSSRPRRIFISERDKNVVWFCVSFDKDDHDVLDHFPLWEPYNAFMKELQDIKYNHAQELIALYNEKQQHLRAADK